MVETEFMINSSIDDFNGLGLFLLKKEPKLKKEKGTLMGFREDFNGMGVFIFKNGDTWTMVGLQNKGMKKLGELKKHAINTNSCTL
jgi:hypothetical protein